MGLTDIALFHISNVSPPEDIYRTYRLTISYSMIAIHNERGTCVMQEKTDTRSRKDANIVTCGFETIQSVYNCSIKNEYVQNFQSLYYERSMFEKKIIANDCGYLYLFLKKLACKNRYYFSSIVPFKSSIVPIFYRRMK